MFVTIDKNHPKHIYQQIYENIKQQILTRKLRAHSKLPSKRDLAKSLNVSLNTVINAFEQLLAEGYIYSIERQGYFVEEISEFEFEKTNVGSRFPEHLKERETSKENWLSLSHMSTNMTQFPFKLWQKCQTEVIELFENELSSLTHPQGPYIVRQTIADLIRSTRGVICEPEQIIIHSTSQVLLEQFLILQGKNTKFAIENPGYARYFHLLKRHIFDVQFLSVDTNGVMIQNIDEDSQYLITTPSHQFPTGVIMSISRRIECLNWAMSKDDSYIIEDDYDSEFKYKTDSIPSLHSLSQNERVIYMGTFSKTMFPGLRISYMVLPVNLLEKYRQHFSSLIQSSNTLVLYTFHRFIQEGHYSKYIKKMNNYYEQTRNKIIHSIEKYFGDEVELSLIPAGLHFLARFKTTKRYEEIEKDAEKYKLEVYTMRRFTLLPIKEERDSRGILIGFANIRNEDIEEAVIRLRKCINKKE